MNNNRKKKFLVVDIESPGVGDKALVYDLGLAVIDNTGRIYEKHSLIIKDIFSCRPKLMTTAYYANKIPEYHERIARGEARLIEFLDMREMVLGIIRDYNIKVVAAYNATFDIGGLDKTFSDIAGCDVKFFPDSMGIEVQCIWHMACQVLFTEKKYLKQALENQWYSQAHNLRTTAEHAFRYISGNLEFEEQHMGLDDVEIEVEIMVKCLSKRKKMDRSPQYMCWKIPNAHHRESINLYFNGESQLSLQF